MSELKDLPNQRPTGVMSTPTSPKTKSAPTTPCSETPTAFHRHTSHIDSQQNSNQASTLPPDIRINMSHQLSTSRSTLLKTRCFQEAPEDIENVSGNNDSSLNIDEKLLDELVRNGDSNLASGEFEGAVKAYSDCIELAKSSKNDNYLRKNPKVFIQRAEANLHLRNYGEAVSDSTRAREINPNWAHAYLVEGKSKFLLGKHADALARFSFGLAQDPTNEELFDALVGYALESEFQDKFEPKYSILKSMNLDRDPFIVMGVLGQELLLSKHQHAAVILTLALKLGTDDKRMKCSILSTISYAYCIMERYEEAINHMHQELCVQSQLEDINGQCRVLTNLGYTYYKMQKFDKSLEAHRKQVSIAMRNHLFPLVSMGLKAIGHVHMAKNDFTGALTSHTRCLDILRLLGDSNFNQFKELLSIGYIQTLLGEYDSAEERYRESIELLDPRNQEEYRMGNIMRNFNLAYLALRKQKYEEAQNYYAKVLKLAKDLPNQQQALIEMRASTAMNHTHNLLKKSSMNYVNELEMS